MRYYSSATANLAPTFCVMGKLNNLRLLCRDESVSVHNREQSSLWNSLLILYNHQNRTLGNAYFLFISSLKYLKIKEHRYIFLWKIDKKNSTVGFIRTVELRKRKLNFPGRNDRSKVNRFPRYRLATNS